MPTLFLWKIPELFFESSTGAGPVPVRDSAIESLFYDLATKKNNLKFHYSKPKVKIPKSSWISLKPGYH